MRDDNRNTLDFNGDGVVDDREIQILKDRELYRRKLSYIALAGIIGASTYLIGFADISRVESVNGLLDMYFITLGGVIAASMGVEAWATRRH